MEKGICAFCQQEAGLTGEHVWSDWINKLLGPCQYEFVKDNSEQGVVGRWTAPSLNVKAKVVCGNCNNRWMSEIENTAKPVLSQLISGGKAFTLTESDIALLSVFSFKVSAVADYMNVEQRLPFYSPSIRKRFSTSLDIPNGVHMWVGRLQSSSIYGLFQTVYYHPRTGTMRGFEFYVLTYILGGMILQVGSIKRVHPMKRPTLPRFAQDPSMDKVTPQFWPSAIGSISWPLVRYLDRESIDEFANRWKSFGITSLSKG